MEKFPVETEEFKSREIKAEIEEIFHAVIDNLKSEETSTVDTKPIILSGDNEFPKPYDDSEFPTTVLQITKDIASLSRCRLCGMPDSNMIDILGFDATSENIPSMINLCLPIMVNETDILPKRVCQPCLKELERCYRFRKTVAEAEEQLLALARVRPDNLEETERNGEFLPSCSSQHGSADGTLKRTSDIDMSNNDLMSNPGNVETVDATVKKEVRLSSLRPCSEVLAAIETRHKNDFAAEKEEKSSSDSRHQNPDITDNKAFHFGTLRASGVGQQSSSDSEVTRTARRSCVVDDMQGKEAENEGHTASNERRYRCTTCAKIFRFRTELTRHNKTHAAVRELHRCDLCFKMYKSEDALYLHNKLHTGKGLYTCDYCGKTSMSEKDMIRHRRVHTGERPFKCSICKKRFSRSCNLKVHKVRVHSERRAYPCSMCDKSFKTLTDRNCHMLVHRDKTSQWQCDHCKCYFKARKGLVRHILRTCRKRFSRK